MANTPKYRAKPIFWNVKRRCVPDSLTSAKYLKTKKSSLPDFIYRFDSTLEFKVFLELVRLFGEHRIIRQHRLEVIPPGWCYPKGRYWKVDFAICNPTNTEEIDYYVEAKGMFLPEFGFVLSSLEQSQPDAFDKLVIVFGNDVPVKNKVIGSLLKSPMANSLTTLKELQKSRQLL